MNGEPARQSYLIAFSNEVSEIHLYNPGIVEAHAFIFGGSEYTEPIVAEGPFVMNSRPEIARACDDFFKGRYGQINIANR